MVFLVLKVKRFIDFNCLYSLMPKDKKNKGLVKFILAFGIITWLSVKKGH